MTTAFLEQVYQFVWGPYLLILLVGLGLFLTFLLRGIQFRYLITGFKILLTDNSSEGRAKGDISHFQSLMTALAASIGIGNIVGVATAITVGGMGALFWMWMMALIGMPTKFAEAILAMKFRIEDKRKEMCGGPMYFIEYGLGWKKLALAFAFFGAIAAFGGGNMIQANAVAESFFHLFHINPMITGVFIAFLTAATILGGIKSVGKVCGVLVPAMTLFYIGGSLFILMSKWYLVPSVIVMIIKTAFNGQAAFGGFAGSTMLIALQTGISRGLMTSEAGLGTASIAAAAAKSDHPGRQALVSMTGSFIATLVLCTMTGLVLGVTQVLGNVEKTGASLTIAAFESTLPFGGLIVLGGIILFAFTTIIGWAYYGEKCIEYLFGEKVVIPYRIVFCLVAFIGATSKMQLVWKISDITNALMAIPNLIGIAFLSPLIKQESEAFFSILKKEEIKKLEIEA